MRVVTKPLRIFGPLLATAALAAAGCGAGTPSASSSYGGQSAAHSKPAQATETPTAKPFAGSTTELAGTKEVAISNFAFKPAHVKVKVGHTVTFVNDDDVAHTATASDGTFDSKTLEQGATFIFKAKRAGTISYVCSFHPNMTGTIVVTN
jgi:plastocyanin